MISDRITILGRSYLGGRKLGTAALCFLVGRDILLTPFLRARPAPLPKGPELTSLCVCQIDHLGDLLMITPVLEELRRFAPRARITLAVGRWCQELAEILRSGGLVDDWIIYTAWPLDSGRRSFWSKLWDSHRSLFSAARMLRAKKLDAIFDLRPWSPNAWLLVALSRARLRVGYGLRGMASVYNCLPPYVSGKSTGQAHLDALALLTGRQREYTAPILPNLPVATRFNLTPGGYFVVQLFSREATRNVSFELWREVLQRLAAELPVVLLGAPIDAERAGKLVALPGVISLLGSTSIAEMLGIIQHSRAVISIDSFAPHVGLAYGRKVAVLMVESISNHRSFPASNPNLRFFPAVPGASAAINEFVTTGSLC